MIPKVLTTKLVETIINVENTQQALITRMRGLIYGNWQTCITYAFAELGIADKLQDGAKNLEYLASQTAIEPKNLFRFLRCCAQLQFIHIDVVTKEITLMEERVKSSFFIAKITSFFYG